MVIQELLFEEKRIENMTKLKVLVTAPYMQADIDRFKYIFEENNIQISLPRVNERLSEKELLECVDGVHGVISVLIFWQKRF